MSQIIQRIFNNSVFHIENIQQYLAKYKFKFKNLSAKEMQDKINEFMFNHIYDMLLLKHKDIICHQIGFNLFHSTHYGSTSIGAIIRNAAYDGNIYIDGIKFNVYAEDQDFQSDLFFIYNKSKEFRIMKDTNEYLQHPDTELYLIKYAKLSDVSKRIVTSRGQKNDFIKKLIKTKLVNDYLPCHTSLCLGDNFDEDFYAEHGYDIDMDLTAIPFPEATSINYEVVTDIFVTIDINKNSTYLDLWKAIDEIYIIADGGDHRFIEKLEYNSDGLLIVDFGS